MGLKLLLPRIWGFLKAWVESHLGSWIEYGIEGLLRDFELDGLLGVIGEDLERGNRRLGGGMTKKLGELKSIKPFWGFRVFSSKTKRIEELSGTLRIIEAL